MRSGYKRIVYKLTLRCRHHVHCAFDVDNMPSFFVVNIVLVNED